MIERPLFIVSSPRSGSSLLFQTMARAPGAFTIGGESHALIEGITPLHPRNRGWDSNVLTAADTTPPIVAELPRRFYRELRDRDGHPASGAVRMIEKTPKNSLRIPFIERVFPDADYLYLYRDARETMSSMLEAWASGRFRTYPLLPGWTGHPWSLLLVPGWRDLIGLPLPQIIAHQWASAMTVLLDDLDKLAPGRVRAISYEAFLAAPQRTVATLCDALGLGWDDDLPDRLPLSPTVVSAPEPDKWRRHEAIIGEIWPIVADVDARAREALERFAAI
jgi:hypothetical protein